MNQLVLDTNVLISGLLSPGNPPGRIVDGIRAGYLQTVVDDRILREYRTVLRRPYFQRYINADEREWIIDFLEHESQRVVCTRAIHGLPDPKDACFLGVAMAAGQPLVTGNIKHFPAKKRAGVRVVTPGDYCQYHAI